MCLFKRQLAWSSAFLHYLTALLFRCSPSATPLWLNVAAFCLSFFLVYARFAMATMNPESSNGTECVTQQLLIPGTKCGLVIGKNGETIKNMQASFLAMCARARCLALHVDASNFSAHIIGFNWRKNASRSRQSASRINAKTAAHNWRAR